MVVTEVPATIPGERASVYKLQSAVQTRVAEQLQEPGCRGAVHRLSQPERVPPEHGWPVTGQRATDFASSGCQEMKMCRRSSLPSLRLLWAAGTGYMPNEAPGFVDKRSPRLQKSMRVSASDSRARDVGLGRR